MLLQQGHLFEEDDTKEKLEEIIFHLAHYAGWPNSVTASNVLDSVWKEMDEEESKT